MPCSYVCFAPLSIVTRAWSCLCQSHVCFPDTVCIIRWSTQCELSFLMRWGIMDAWGHHGRSDVRVHEAEGSHF